MLVSRLFSQGLLVWRWWSDTCHSWPCSLLEWARVRGVAQCRCHIFISGISIPLPANVLGTWGKCLMPDAITSHVMPAKCQKVVTPLKRPVKSVYFPSSNPCFRNHYRRRGRLHRRSSTPQVHSKIISRRLRVAQLLPLLLPLQVQIQIPHP